MKKLELNELNITPLSSEQTVFITGGDCTGINWYLVQWGRIVDDFVTGFADGFDKSYTITANH
jgi:hypothetical protein